MVSKSIRRLSNAGVKMRFIPHHEDDLIEGFGPESENGTINVRATGIEEFVNCEL